ncbi:MAG: HAD family hydrolase [Deltaproteobacteria bacterium]|nr:HAD family hydrolase [Deltaproteobacteria bacterium]
MDLTKVNVCIFDVNGVLIDSNLANARAMGQAFTDDPLTQEQIARFYLTLTGIDRGEKIRRVQAQVIQRPFAENEFELRWEKLKDLTGKSMSLAPLAVDCKHILKALAKLDITRVALSNTPLNELRRILAGKALEPLLDIIRGGGNWPKTDSLNHLLDEFEFSPETCLFIGDGKGDLWAARAAGVSFVAIDPSTGEFDGEHGLNGPFTNLADWGRQAGLI